MPRYLTELWIAEAADAVAAAADLERAAPARPIGLTQVVEGGANGPVVYYLTTHDPTSPAVRGPARLDRGPADPEDVRLRTDQATAVALAQGTVSAQRAFVEGRLVISGDVDRLVEAQALFAALDAALAPLRACTSYGDDGDDDDDDDDHDHDDDHDDDDDSADGRGRRA